MRLMTRRYEDARVMERMKDLIKKGRGRRENAREGRNVMEETEGERSNKKGKEMRKRDA